MHLQPGPRLWATMAAAAALCGAVANAGAATLCVNAAKSGCFATIAAALAAAKAGDTIAVAAGKYKEGDLVIGKSLSLVGAGAASTVINAAGNGNGVYIDGLDNAGLGEVAVTGFTVENAKFEGILVTNASAVTISGNSVAYNDKALDPSKQTCPGLPPFETSEGEDCGEGVHLIGVEHSIVAGNLVVNNAGGILLSDDTGATQNNLITGNTVEDNPYDCGITLASHPLYSKAPTSVRGVDDNTIAGNESRDNGLAVEGAGAGVGLFVAPAPGTGGLETAGNVVIGNTLSGNGLPGVAFHLHSAGPGQNVDDNLVTQNEISGNGADTMDAATPGPTGINVFGAAPIAGTVIAQNDISGEQIDIAANNGGAIDAHLNNLTGGKTGVDNLGKGTVNATLNWWGCRKGPGGAGCSTVAGTGVTFAPWLLKPAAVPQ
jgi:parallel beta-helix repeat protein